MRVRPVRNKHLSTDKKTAAVELWKAGIPLSNIRAQLGIGERTLRRLLTFAKKNPERHVMVMDDSSYLRNLVTSMPRRMQDVIRREGGLTKY